ncbi:MAG TPA: outer membrane protein assembly factor BamB [Burkholderiales bacterium]|nr:outer membrane protein assembly factor BamB [Burkholderiales bacterium]
MPSFGSISKSWLFAIVVIPALVSCGGSDAVKPAELRDFKPSAKPQVVWRSAAGKAKFYVFKPAIYGDSVYAAGYDGHLERLNLATGKQIWRVDTKEKLSGGVGAGGNVVLVGTDKGAVLAYDLGGKLLWRSQLTSEILSAPRAAEGIVIVRSGDGRIFGLDAASGERKWEYQVNLPPLLLRTSIGVHIVGDLAIVGLPAGKVIALNVANGNLVWDTTIAAPKGDNELERITDIAGTLVVDGDRVCAVAYQGRVACLDATKGTIAWGRDASSATPLSADTITLYLTDASSVVVAYDRETGASVWKQDKLLNREVSGPAVVGEFVVVGDMDGYVHVLSSEDGSFAARLRTDGSPIVAQPVAGGPGVIVQTRKGDIYAISIK